MKIVFTLLVILQSTALFAGKTYSLDYTFIDEETKKVIPELTVQLLNNQDVVIATKDTDENGHVHFSELTIKEGRLKIIQSEEFYLIPYLSIYNSRKNNIERTVHLTVTIKVKEKRFNEIMEKRNLAYKDAGPTFGTSEDSEVKCDKENFVDTDFLGGLEGFQKFVLENVRYPQEAIEMNEQGRVYLGIIIEADGTVTNIVILKKTDSANLNLEAKRLISTSPNWIPASCNGVNVRSRAVFPINFSLN